LDLQPRCPEYRVRLFMSVDLVGSTAFKAASGGETAPGTPLARWIIRTRHFYRTFPTIYLRRYGDEVGSEELACYKEMVPRLWKTIGDEIIFCCRVLSVTHAACAVMAFVKTLKEYGDTLDGFGPGLDVKGCAWVAAFPAPNLTVRIPTDGSYQPSDATTDNRLPDENDEARADSYPHNFDFLGKNLDSGFRMSKYSASDRLSVSAELAFILCEAAHHDHFSASFMYHGRESLKGVIKERPYPIVTVDTERSTRRKEIVEFERAVTRSVDARPLQLKNFLSSFMDDAGIEKPALPMTLESAREKPNLPKSYQDFKDAWQKGLESEKKLTEVEQISADSQDDGTQALPDTLQQALKQAVSVANAANNPSTTAKQDASETRP